MNPDQVVIKLSEGLSHDTFEIFRVAVYDSGAIESLADLSREQVDTIAETLLPNRASEDRLSLLAAGLLVSEHDWDRLRQAYN